MEFHEIANIFPLDEGTIDDLAASIRRRGLEVAIETMDGKILDGRRRYLACQRAGVTPWYRDVRPDDPIDYVWALNAERRQLSKTQTAVAADKAEALREKLGGEAKERQRAALVRGNKTRHGKGSPIPEHVPESANGDARDKLGAKYKISGRLIDHARKVRTKGTPQLYSAVEADKLSVSTAAKLASQSPAEQNAVAERVMSGKSYRRARPAEEDVPDEPDEETNGEIKLQGVGVFRAHEAINCLARIPKNDRLRKRGFQIVTDWIKRNP